MLGKFPVLPIWIRIGQGSPALAVGAEGGLFGHAQIHSWDKQM